MEVKSEQKFDRTMGSVLGMAVGDSKGAPFEFRPLKKISEDLNLQQEPLIWETPVKFQSLKLGQWTDDTSQGLNLLEAFVFNAAHGKEGFNPEYFMDLNWKWWHEKHNSGLGGEPSVGLGGIVDTTLNSWGLSKRKNFHVIENSFIAVFKDEIQRTDVRCDGNGSTMRCAAPAIFAKSLEDAMFLGYQQSLVTTPGLQSAACAALMAYLAYQAIHSDIKDPNELKKTLLSEENLGDFLTRLLRVNEQFSAKYRIVKGSEDYQLIECLCKSQAKQKTRLLSTTVTQKTKNETAETNPKEIFPTEEGYQERYKKALNSQNHKFFEKTNNPNITIKYKLTEENNNYLNWRTSHKEYQLDGPGNKPADSTYYGSYVVEGFALALHILFNTNSFDEAIKMAALMKGDADSNAAVVGILAGAIYGQSNINSEWLKEINQYPLNQGSDITIIPFVENSISYAPCFKTAPAQQIKKENKNQPPIAQKTELFLNDLTEDLERIINENNLTVLSRFCNFLGDLQQRENNKSSDPIPLTISKNLAEQPDYVGELPYSQQVNEILMILRQYIVVLQQIKGAQQYKEFEQAIVQILIHLNAVLESFDSLQKENNENNELFVQAFSNCFDLLNQAINDAENMLANMSKQCESIISQLPSQQEKAQSYQKAIKVAQENVSKLRAAQYSLYAVALMAIVTSVVVGLLVALPYIAIPAGIALLTLIISEAVRQKKNVTEEAIIANKGGLNTMPKTFSDYVKTDFKPAIWTLAVKEDPQLTKGQHKPFNPLKKL